MNEQNLRFRIGVFVLAALVLLGALITLFGRFPRMLSRATEYTLRFDDVTGVKEGTPVLRSGVRIGEVTGLELEEDTGEVLVRVQIDRPHTITENLTPTIIPGFLLNESTISFVPRKSPMPQVQGFLGLPPDDLVAQADPPQRVPEGAQIRGTRQPDLGSIIPRAQDVLPTTQQTLDEIRRSVQRFEKLAPLMEETAREYRDLARATRGIVPELQKTNDEVRELAKAARETVPEVKRAAAEVGDLAKASREALPEARKVAGEVGELSKAIRETIPEYKRAAAEVGDLAKAARESFPGFQKTNEEIQALARMVRDAAPDVLRTNDEIRELARAAREAVPEIKKTATEAQVTLRTFDRTGERLNVLLQTNEGKLTALLDQGKETLERANRVLSDENQKNFTAGLRNLRDVTENAQTLIKNADSFLSEGRDTVKRLNEPITRTNELLDNLNKVVNPLGPRAEAITANLDEATRRVNAVLGDVQQLIRAVDKADGTVGRLLTDPSLYNQLDQAACQVNKILPRVDRVLRDVEVFADKIARHPESLGVGGAVRPSAGLKESPTAPLFLGKP